MLQSVIVAIVLQKKMVFKVYDITTKLFFSSVIYNIFVCLLLWPLASSSISLFVVLQIVLQRGVKDRGCGKGLFLLLGAAERLPVSAKLELGASDYSCR